MNTAKADIQAAKDVIMSKVADLRKAAEEAARHLVARKNTADWVADKLLKLADLDPHSWDRATLRELAEALTSSPKLGRKEMEGGTRL